MVSILQVFPAKNELAQRMDIQNTQGNRYMHEQRRYIYVYVPVYMNIYIYIYKHFTITENIFDEQIGINKASNNNHKI